MLGKGLAFIFLSIAVFAEPVDELLVKLEKSSPLVKAQKSVLSAKEKDISIQTNYKNPKLSFGVNDIILSKDKYNSFDLEPMQTQYIALSQEIDNSDKLDSKKSIAVYAIKKEGFILEDLYLNLVKELRTINMQLSKSQSILKLLEQKVANLKTLKQYFENTTNTMTNISLISKVDENIYKTKEQKYNLLTKIESLKNSYSYILNEEYKKFDDNLDDLQDKKEFEQTPKYKVLQIEQNIAKERINYAKLQETPNVTLNIAYNRRDSFDDFLNLSVGIPLPVYGTEEQNVVKNNELFRKSSFVKDNFLRKVNMKYENLKSKTLFLKDSLNDISLALESLNTQISYDHSSIELISNTPKIIENKNSKIDFQIKKIKLQEQIDINRLEIDYITTKSKL